MDELNVRCIQVGDTRWVDVGGGYMARADSPMVRWGWKIDTANHDLTREDIMGPHTD